MINFVITFLDLNKILYKLTTYTKKNIIIGNQDNDLGRYTSNGIMLTLLN